MIKAYVWLEKEKLDIKSFTGTWMLN